MSPSNFIKLVFTDDIEEGNCVRHFRIKVHKSTKFHTIFNKYSEMRALRLNRLIFRFNNSIIKNENSLEDLNMLDHSTTYYVSVYT